MDPRPSSSISFVRRQNTSCIPAIEPGSASRTMDIRSASSDMSGNGPLACRQGQSSGGPHIGDISLACSLARKDLRTFRPLRCGLWQGGDEGRNLKCRGQMPLHARTGPVHRARPMPPVHRAAETARHMQSSMRCVPALRMQIREKRRWPLLRRTYFLIPHIGPHLLACARSRRDIAMIGGMTHEQEVSPLIR